MLTAHSSTYDMFALIELHGRKFQSVHIPQISINISEVSPKSVFWSQKLNLSGTICYRCYLIGIILSSKCFLHSFNCLLHLNSLFGMEGRVHFIFITVMITKGKITKPASYCYNVTSSPVIASFHHLIVALLNHCINSSKVYIKIN